MRCTVCGMSSSVINIFGMMIMNDSVTNHKSLFGGHNGVQKVYNYKHIQFK